MRRVVDQTLILLSLALIPAVAAGLWHPSLPAWDADVLADGEVALATVEGWLGPVLWLDARQAGAYEQGHWPGALLLNEDDWEALVLPVMLAWTPGAGEELGVRVVVYCDAQACRSSHEVADRLRDETGWENVYVLHGGWAVLSGEVK